MKKILLLILSLFIFSCDSGGSDEPDCPEEWKPQRLDKKFKWWKQKLKKAEQQDKFNADRLQRENEASKKNQITKITKINSKSLK